MSFELYQPRSGLGPPIQPGHCRFDRCGNLRFNASDAARAQIRGPKVSVLVDKDLRRIGLRAPREGEGSLALQTKTKKRGVPLSSFVTNMRGPLKSLGLDPVNLAGDRELTVCVGKEKDPLLSINLAADGFTRPLSAGGRPRKKK